MASKAAVNRPTDVKFKEQNVNDKLQLYGIWSAFASGKVPSNKQIDIALNSALESRELSAPPEKLSEEGKKLVADLRDVVEKAKLLLLSKNQGDLLQEFIWDTEQINVKDAKLPTAPVEKETAKQHGNEVLRGVRTLGTLIITNGQFRKLLADMAIMVRSMAGDVASKAADKLQPTEDQMQQIDAPAEDNTWHEAPDVSKAKIQDQLKGIKAKAPFGKKGVTAGSVDDPAVAYPQGQMNTTDPAVAVQQKQVGILNDPATGTQVTDQSLVAKTNGDAKKKLKEYHSRGQNYLSRKMPKERREQTIWRLKKMVVEIQGHADYQEAVETLLRLAEEYGGHGKAVATEGQGTLKHSYHANKPTLSKLKTLLERFANGTSSDDFFDALDQIYRDADKDEELREWFKSVDTYIRRCLREQGYIMQPIAKDDFNTLYDHGRHLLRGKYRNHTDRILDEMKFFGNQFDEDPMNKDFRRSIERLFRDLGNDEGGSIAWKPHLLKDVTSVILPEVLEKLYYVPIPRMEYSDPRFDIIVENLIVESDNLAPNILELSSDNYFKWARKTGSSNRNKNSVMLAASGIQMDLKDVSFYVNNKSGLFKIKDQGLCDIFMGGEGFGFKLKMETADKGNQTHFFTISDVKVQVKNFDIKLKQSNHKLLFLLGKPFLVRAMRPALQLVLETAIKQKARELDGLAYDIHREARAATRDAANNPDRDSGDAKSMYQHYWNAAHARWLQRRKRAKTEQEADLAAGKGKKFNMAMTQDDSIFPAIQLPSGISTKATEYRQLARTGDRWESPVFSIGTAKETAKIPAAPEVRRKKHAFSGKQHHDGAIGTTDGMQQDAYGAQPGAMQQGAMGMQQPGAMQQDAMGAQPGAMGAQPAYGTQSGAMGAIPQGAVPHGAVGGFTNGLQNNGASGLQYEKHIDRSKFDPLSA